MAGRTHTFRGGTRFHLPCGKKNSCRCLVESEVAFVSNISAVSCLVGVGKLWCETLVALAPVL